MVAVPATLVYTCLACGDGCLKGCLFMDINKHHIFYCAYWTYGWCACTGWYWSQYSWIYLIYSIFLCLAPVQSSGTLSVNTTNPFVLFYSTESESKLGTFYNSHLLLNYGGLCFNHQKAQLKRSGIWAKDRKLIPPWKLYEVLKPGTLIPSFSQTQVYTVMSTVKNHWWRMNARYGDTH